MDNRLIFLYQCTCDGMTHGEKFRYQLRILVQVMSLCSVRQIRPSSRVTMRAYIPFAEW